MSRQPALDDSPWFGHRLSSQRLPTGPLGLADGALEHQPNLTAVPVAKVPEVAPGTPVGAQSRQEAGVVM